MAEHESITDARSTGDPFKKPDVKEPIVAEEVAEAEFERFVETMGIDIDDSTLEDEDKASLKLQKTRIINAIKSGALVFNEYAEPIFTPQRSENTDPITFHEPTGASLMAMDKKKATQEIAKLFGVMADMTREPASNFAKLKVSDLNVCGAITLLFLG